MKTETFISTNLLEILSDHLFFTADLKSLIQKGFVFLKDHVLGTILTLNEMWIYGEFTKVAELPFLKPHRNDHVLSVRSNDVFGFFNKMVKGCSLVPLMMPNKMNFYHADGQSYYKITSDSKVHLLLQENSVIYHI